MKIFCTFLIAACLQYLPFMQLSAEVPLCYKSIEANFFDPALVDEAFSLQGISQSNWSLIKNELQAKMQRVPALVKEKAMKLDPNPFIPQFKPQAAAEVLRQVLFTVFAETLADFHVTNLGKVQEMFDYIRQRQSQRLLACFGQEVERTEMHPEM